MQLGRAILRPQNVTIFSGREPACTMTNLAIGLRTAPTSQKSSSVRLVGLINRSSLPINPAEGFCLWATVAWESQSKDLEALVDAEGNFLDLDLVTRLGIPTQPLASPVEAMSLSGRHITHVSRDI